MGPAKGGVRFNADLSMGEVAAMAMLMTWKCALMNLPSLEKYWALHNSIGYDTAAVTTEFSHYTQYSVPGFQANAVECVDALRALCSSGLKGPVPVVVHTVGFRTRV